MAIRRLSAITFGVRDMARTFRFYQSAGFQLEAGSTSASFTTFRDGESFLNFIATPQYEARWWGRAIFWVDDVDAHYRALLDAGLSPEAPPRDAAWGERYFHIKDPDGHELSFAQPLEQSDRR